MIFLARIPRSALGMHPEVCPELCPEVCPEVFPEVCLELNPEVCPEECPVVWSDGLHFIYLGFLQLLLYVKQFLPPMTCLETMALF